MNKHLRMIDVWILMAWEIVPPAIIPCVLSEVAIVVVEVRDHTVNSGRRCEDKIS